jgi:hypothetical protein
MPPLSTIRRTLISPPHGSVNAPPVSIAILGNDAFLASAPARPVQLMHAALAAGFDAVVPASLGDELVAGETLRLAQLYGRRPVVQCACPFAQAQLCTRTAQMESVAIAVAPAAVALARALRLERGSSVHITYIGGCPGAQDPAIDLQVLPARFLRGLQEKGVRLAEQPDVFLDRLPPDRRRFLSEPGGLPRADLVDSVLRRSLVSLSGYANPLLSVADALFDGGVTMIDPAGAYHCVCAGADTERNAAEGRSAIAELEPARAASPIFEAPARLDLRPTVPAANSDVEHTARVDVTDPARVEAPPAMATAPRVAASERASHASPAVAAESASTRRIVTPPSVPALNVSPVSPLRAPSLEREVPLASARDADSEQQTPTPAARRPGYAAWLDDDARPD